VVVVLEYLGATGSYCLRLARLRAVHGTARYWFFVWSFVLLFLSCRVLCCCVVVLVVSYV